MRICHGNSMVFTDDLLSFQSFTIYKHSDMERKEIDKTRPVTYYLSLTDEQLNFLSSNEGGINRIQCFRRLLHHTATADTTYTKRGISKPLMQGQTCVSALELSKEWNCNRKTVRFFVNFGGKKVAYSRLKYLIINTLISIIKVADVRIF